VLPNMTTIAKTLAREWLTLTAGIVVGFFLVPAFVYVFLSPAEYTSKHSLMDHYGYLIGMLFGKRGGSDIWVAVAIILCPYLLFQFGRSIIWAIRTVKNKEDSQ
jgi:hypothetical protein